ncbi:chloroplast-localized Ptr ToxA-binding protein 1 [Zea mays]|uniref:Chloroplast-localized Ptr ToxA-binding protein1 n=3 Tax=Zea mays TaxID=4577 RepID=B4FEK7_MAIZE|nr:chloroplast-localized Ptr ToxA-binding protein 1 [Zea mays]ACF80550.1 unknown [Zea mays]ACG41839.1 chloroplast-localized Ptr ToxA-binding protein1 [Zea mays]ONM58303.1 Protein THYLAKOID FORMATION 1 chloroplastic [Zea mays]|eukprot:NP_001131923.1 chloroplast-localized Ptr ToxA-binding protein 1 [Zea mays]
MAAISSLPFAALRGAAEWRPSSTAAAVSGAVVLSARSRRGSRSVVRCVATTGDVPPTVAETKLNFLKSYKRPIPSIYSAVLQELLVQQHLMRYKKTYQYDAVFALGFVTVYDQLMEGYPSNEDRDSIFKAYITALNEDPDQYRADALKMEEWARSQNGSSLVDFSSRDGEIEAILKDISERAKGKGNFSYSRFFAVGLFRLLELSNATEPTILDKLCAALNVSKRSVDRDLDVYRNILSKLVQAKELLKEYVDREKKKREERSEAPKPNEAVTKFDGNLYSTRH